MSPKCYDKREQEQRSFRRLLQRAFQILGAMLPIKKEHFQKEYLHPHFRLPLSLRKCVGIARMVCNLRLGFVDPKLPAFRLPPIKPNSNNAPQKFFITIIPFFNPPLSYLLSPKNTRKKGKRLASPPGRNSRSNASSDGSAGIN